MRLQWLFGAAALLAAASVCAGGARFSVEAIDKGREQYNRTCKQCHGHHMINAGTTVYDLRKFPTDQPDRFRQSVLQGKGAMPSWKETLSAEQIEWLWAYVGSRGGKEPYWVPPEAAWRRSLAANSPPDCWRPAHPPRGRHQRTSKAGSAVSAWGCAAGAAQVYAVLWRC